MDSLVLSQPLVPGVQGIAVKCVQEWLTLRGHPTAITGRFDSATAAAVSHFRAQRNLGPGSVVDQQVYAELLAPLRRAIEPVAPQASLAAATLAVAEQQLREAPLEVGGQNRGPWVRLYMEGKEGAYGWCGGFVSWCLERAALAQGAPLPLRRASSCAALAANAVAAGLLIAGTVAERLGRLRPGHLFLLPAEATGEWTHVGIVRTLGATTFDTIEGNSPGPNQPNGDRVFSRQRPYECCAFVVFEPMEAER
jgi:hypothetical protein